MDVNLILVVPVGFGNLRWLRPPSGSLTRNVLIGVGFVGIPWWILFWTVGGHSGLFGLGVGSVLGWCGVLHGSRPIIMGVVISYCSRIALVLFLYFPPGCDYPGLASGLSPCYRPTFPGPVCTLLLNY